MKIATFLFREGTVSYSDSGKGRTVFLLHGFLESAEMWAYYSEMLSPYFRVIAIDLPGHGKTESFGYVHSMELMADCVYAAMRHLKLRKIFIAGHSMGGYTALAFGEKYPDHLYGMCLINSTAYADSEAKKKERDKAISLAKRNSKSWIRTVIPNLFYREHKKHAHAVKRYRRIAQNTSLRGILASQEGMKIRNDRSIVLKFAPYPVMIVAGEKDPFFKLRDIKTQAQLAGNSRLLVLEDVGHMAIEEARDKTWTSIKRFFHEIIRKKLTVD